MAKRLISTLVILLFAACAPAAAPTLAPTLQLIEPTATSVPAPVTPDDALLAADQLGTSIPADLTPEADLTDDAFGGDPIAAELALLAQTRLAETLDLPTRRIQVVSVEPVTWPDASLGCPQPDTAYAQVLVDGYRLVLEAGDHQYVFHSDFDRVIPCDSEATPEATA